MFTTVHHGYNLCELPCQVAPGPRPPCSTKTFCSMRAARGSLVTKCDKVQHKVHKISVRWMCVKSFKCFKYITWVYQSDHSVTILIMYYQCFHFIEWAEWKHTVEHTRWSIRTQRILSNSGFAKAPLKERLKAFKNPSALFSTESISALTWQVATIKGIDSAQWVKHCKLCNQCGTCIWCAFI